MNQDVATAGSDAGADAPEALTTAVAPVEACLHHLFDAERAAWADADPELAAVPALLGDFVLGGGKRLRPAFCHWGFIGAGGPVGARSTVEVGAALELLHAFALLHDDVMDGSAQRRGRPALHRLLEDRHLAERWRGEARRFGEGVSVLVGDLALVYADRLAARHHDAVTAVWDRLKVELTMGQYLDVTGSANGARDPARATRVAALKSGRYTVERPLHLGAALAGRLEDLEVPYSAFGGPLGEAFQLRDDVLGVFGDEAVLGKPVGDDLREGKPTLLLAVATERIGTDHPLLARIGEADLTAGEVGELRDLFAGSGAVAEVEAAIDARLEQALTALAAAPITAEARDALTEIAVYVARRDR